MQRSKNDAFVLSGENQVSRDEHIDNKSYNKSKPISQCDAQSC